jgi:uncharacterized membrane protein HdeD (DUF308 family)
MDELHTGAGTRPVHTFDSHASWAAHNWGWVLALAMVAVGFGIALISSAFASLSVLAWFAGLFMLFMGVTELLVPVRSGTRGARLAGAAIAIAGGVILLVWPGETLTVLAFVAGIAFTAWGVISVVMALRSRREGESSLWGIVVGVALAALGILMMAWPTGTLTVVGVLLGVVAIAWGVVTALHALELRRTGLHWQETRRLEHERIEQSWNDFERAEGAGQSEPAERPPETKAA